MTFFIPIPFPGTAADTSSPEAPLSKVLVIALFVIAIIFSICWALEADHDDEAWSHTLRRMSETALIVALAIGLAYDISTSL